MYRKFTLLITCLVLFSTHAQHSTQGFDFDFEKVTLNGVLTFPKNTTPKGMVLLVHGSGRTNAVAQQWYLDVRKAINKAGYATYIWDKMGCGQSGGIFNYNQTVYNSAFEVIAAIEQLKQANIPGTETIGLWGVSRAGWINPIVINTYKNIQFWISVSGVDAKENFQYLFEENLKINGTPKDSIALLSKELNTSYRMTHAGASFEAVLNATKNLRKNAFLKRFNNGRASTKQQFEAYQQQFMKERLDSITGLQINVANFDNILSNVRCPVLAIFGEKDTQVDWKKTKRLYEQTIGKNTKLTMQSFPNANHNLFQCKTGGFYEFEDHNLAWERPEGYLETITQWLQKLE